MTLDTEKLKE